MAQLIWAEQCRQRGARMVVSSAGLDARPGQGPDAMCVALLAERGLDLAGHRARRLDFARIADLDLILVMENIHAQRLCSTMPLLQGRVHLLGRWGAGEIIDPHGRERARYEHCLDLIEAAVGQWLLRLT